MSNLIILPWLEVENANAVAGLRTHEPDELVGYVQIFVVGGIA